eukprot:1578033-Rhodomonas_salina.2
MSVPHISQNACAVRCISTGHRILPLYQYRPSLLRQYRTSRSKRVGRYPVEVLRIGGTDGRGRRLSALRTPIR